MQAIMKIRNIILISFLVFFASKALAQENSSKIRRFVTDSINEIANFPTVDVDVVGVVGTMTSQLERFDFLYSKAFTTELVEMMNNESPNVRAYAFWILALRKYDGIKTLLESNLMDSSIITCRRNCYSYKITLSGFYLQVLSPGTPLTHGAILTRKEFLKYYKQIQQHKQEEGR